jgi:hypothetical protein
MKLALDVLLLKMEAEDVQTAAIRRFTEWVLVNPDVPIQRMFWQAGMTRN